jgi:coenzyme F420-dependent glucose-6-phosphate dehydrogenase
MVRRLWAGETVDGKGSYFCAKRAKLHTLPPQPPPLYVSAFYPEAAKVAARYGDGLWTLADPDSTPQLIEIYRSQREEDGKDQGEIVLQSLVAWGPDDEAALEGARVWKGAQPPGYYYDDWHDPQAMYEHAEQTISEEEFRRKAIISADPHVHIERLQQVAQLGATGVAVFNCSGADPEGSIRVYAEQVLPALR